MLAFLTPAQYITPAEYITIDALTETVVPADHQSPVRGRPAWRTISTSCGRGRCLDATEAALKAF